MNSERVNAIRAALDEHAEIDAMYNHNMTPTDHQRIRYQAISDELPTYLRHLLAELDKLNAVVEAARVYVASPEAGHTYLRVTQERFAALRDGVAALTGEGGK